MTAKRRLNAEDAKAARWTPENCTQSRPRFRGAKLDAEHLSIKLKPVIPAQAGTQLLQLPENSARSPGQYFERLRALDPRFRGDDNPVCDEKELRVHRATSASSALSLPFAPADLPTRRH